MKIEDVALVLLASGLSRRFGQEDKLLADLGGRPLLARSAALFADQACAGRLAVVGTGQAERRALLKAAGWTLVDNPDPMAGQGASLALGIAAAARSAAQGAAVALADSPFVNDSHLAALADAIGDRTAAFSRAGVVVSPPSLFRRAAFAALQGLCGDRGAKAVLHRVPDAVFVDIAPEAARDVDTAQDLADLRAQPWTS